MGRLACSPRAERRLTMLLGLLLLVSEGRGEGPASPEGSDHWAFQPVRETAVPVVKNAGWCRNPIDRFVLAKLEEKGWKPAPAATPEALLRRISFDLVGLPPTPERRAAFLAGITPEAVDRLVDELLMSPAYGERWARHWLDVVRYAESNGYERDAAKPSVWRYRDYVIRAFNEDKPFDRFLVEQLAGDELGDADTETVVATTYYRLGAWDDEPADPRQDRFDQLDDIVATTSEVFLGLTLACARCHDHKFEPLTSNDYYRMVAIFDGLSRPRNGRTETDVPAGSREQLDAIAARDRKIAAVERRIAARLTIYRTLSWRFLTGQNRLSIAELEAIRSLDPAEHQADLAAIARLRTETPDLPRAYVFQEPSPTPTPTHRLLRGQAATPGPEVAPGVPAILGATPLVFPKGERTSLRRLTLARWLARPEHPLTARVIVNRVWQHHFGEGLVRTPSDFGTMGDPPTHPELLDWLADWFVQHGWSIKALHRLILASNTYRMSTRGDSRYAAEDPENRLLWHVPYHRLDVEAIRDAMLEVGGEANRSMFGPGMYPLIPREALESHSDPNQVWKSSTEREASRRTIYAFVKRSLPVPMLELLDFCDTARSAAKRNVTSIAPQALTLFNGDFVNRQARHFAARLERETDGSPSQEIERAILLALGRLPTSTERATLFRFLEAEAGEAERERSLTPESARRAALEQVCRAIFNMNEFVYCD